MKRIVICADGTWCDPDQADPRTGRRRPTNVTKVARAVLPRAGDGTNQVVFYHDGIGTQGLVDHLLGGAFGHGVGRNICDLYRFVVYNYVAGDEIHLFGFSRGAFTVRSLAGFMHRFGLIEKDDDFYVPDIFACYERRQGVGSPMWTKIFKNIRGTRPCPPIRFVGVWDTVGALGAPGLLGQLVDSKKYYRYHEVGLHAAIENACQALAIDERRRPFAPSIWRRPHGWRGALEQAWFPGDHSNVGGGLDPDGLANEALHWMVEKAEGVGLEFDAAYLAQYAPCFNSRLEDPLTLGFRLLGTETRALGRHAADGEAVHQSAIDRMDLAECRYHPANLEAALGRMRIVTTTRVIRGRPCHDLRDPLWARAAA